MNRLVGALVVVAIVLGGVGGAEAKTDRPHSSTHSRAAKPKSAPTSAYVVVKCKTKACLKKHPSGVYAFKPKPKKT